MALMLTLHLLMPQPAMHAHLQASRRKQLNHSLHVHYTLEESTFK
jgi:hypothetical protein